MRDQRFYRLVFFYSFDSYGMMCGVVYLTGGALGSVLFGDFFGLVGRIATIGSGLIFSVSFGGGLNGKLGFLGGLGSFELKAENM